MKEKFTELTPLDGAEPALTVRGVRVRPLEVVPDRPVETAAGTLSTVPLVLIDLQTAEGIVGRSYVRCYTSLALAATARLRSSSVITGGGRTTWSGATPPKRPTT